MVFRTLDLRIHQKACSFRLLIDIDVIARPKEEI